MDAEDVVRRLGLLPHPEGGYYRETYRSRLTLELPDGRRRAASTAIHYLIPAGAWSTWHRVASDEVWHHYDGGVLRLHLLGVGTRVLHPGDPQATVPAGVWQAAEPEGEAVLCGCTVAPGFEFQDFELGRADELVISYPEDEPLIRRLAR
jgi:predicted cupin superfamily sugar epimerase